MSTDDAFKPGQILLHCHVLPPSLAAWLCVFTAGLHVARIMKECTDSLVIRCTNHMFSSYSLVYMHLSNNQWCLQYARIIPKQSPRVRVCTNAESNHAQ